MFRWYASLVFLPFLLLGIAAAQYYHTFLIEYVRVREDDPEPHYCRLYHVGRESRPPTLIDAFDSDRQALFDYCHPRRLVTVGLVFENGVEILVDLRPDHQFAESHSSWLRSSSGKDGAINSSSPPPVYPIAYNYALKRGWPAWSKAPVMQQAIE
jgi:hypothetical protein